MSECCYLAEFWRFEARDAPATTPLNWAGLVLIERSAASRAVNHEQGGEQSAKWR